MVEVAVPAARLEPAHARIATVPVWITSANRAHGVTVLAFGPFTINTHPQKDHPAGWSFSFAAPCCVDSVPIAPQGVRQRQRGGQSLPRREQAPALRDGSPPCGHRRNSPALVKPSLFVRNSRKSLDKFLTS